MIFVIGMIIGILVGFAIGCYVLISIYANLVDSLNDIYSEYLELKQTSDEELTMKEDVL